MECGSDGGDLSPQHHQPPTHSYKPSKFLTPWTLTDQGTLASLLERESHCTDRACWHRQQLDLTEGMRCRVVDWMMDVASDFCMKRDTFHGAVWILDSVLSSSLSVTKKTLQLVALVSVMLSAKLEEVTTPSICDYAETAEYGYSAGEIRSMERAVLRELQWKIAPSALSVWVNWTLALWDRFVTETLAELPLFKVPHKDAYSSFRYCFQLADSVLLQSSHYLYSKPQLCSALLYLSLVHSLCLTDSLTSVCLCKDREVLAAWERFVVMVFGVNIGEIEEVVDYVWQEGKVRGNMALPKVCTVYKQSVLERHFEDFLSYQTY